MQFRRALLSKNPSAVELPQTEVIHQSEGEVEISEMDMDGCFGNGS